MLQTNEQNVKMMFMRLSGLQMHWLIRDQILMWKETAMKAKLSNGEHERQSRWQMAEDDPTTHALVKHPQMNVFEEIGKVCKDAETNIQCQTKEHHKT